MKWLNQIAYGCIRYLIQNVANEKYIVHQTEQGYKIDYYRKGRYKRSIEYHNAEFVETLLKQFKKDCPRGQIIFSGNARMRSPEEMMNLERKVREYEP